MIDIIVTCYNRERYLAQCIESILHQTYSNFNLLVWDDGSTDNSLEVAKQYTVDNRVKVIEASHKGFTASLKSAIDSTDNPYLAWVDSDDYLAPNCLEETLSILESQPKYGMVYTQYFDVDSSGNVLNVGSRSKFPYSQHTLLHRFITFHFRLIRREIYQSVGGIDLNYKTAADYDLCLRLSENTEIYQLNQPLYYYRKHEHQISQILSNDQSNAARLAVYSARMRRAYAS